MISIVIPAYNEAESIPRLYQEIEAAASASEWDIEVIFVDDGSSDGTWAAVEALAERDPRVHAIRFRYFDPVARRAGLPPDVAALVEQLSADSADFADSGRD
jgi:glycosyltransferase involved in cell wall biosynthesis